MKLSPIDILIPSSRFSFPSDLTLKWTLKSCSMLLLRLYFVDVERKSSTQTTSIEKSFPADLM